LIAAGIFQQAVSGVLKKFLILYKKFISSAVARNLTEC